MTKTVPGGDEGEIVISGQSTALRFLGIGTRAEPSA